MEALLREAGAATVLDIGCGEGRLVEHLIKQVSSNARLSAVPTLLFHLQEQRPSPDGTAVYPASVLSTCQGSVREQTCCGWKTKVQQATSNEQPMRRHTK